MIVPLFEHSDLFVYIFTAKKFGCTDFINPKALSRSVPEELIDRLDGGADFTFECVGNVKTMVRNSLKYQFLSKSGICRYYEY